MSLPLLFHHTAGQVIAFRLAVRPMDLHCSLKFSPLRGAEQPRTVGTEDGGVDPPSEERHEASGE